MEETKTTEAEKDQPTMLGGLKNLGICVIILGVAYYFYTTMTAYENGEGVSMNRILYLAYEIAGKNITTGILAIIGGLVGFSGVKE